MTQTTGAAPLDRAAAVALVERLPEHALPERLTALRGSVRFDLTHDGDVVTRVAATLAGGVVEVLPEPDAPVDVVLRLPASHLADLLGGIANAGLDLLSGRLVIEGDAEMALALGGVFVVPGTEADPVAVDPRALDPVAVACALVGVPTSHLRAVMAGGFRAVVLEEVFTRLPSFLDARKAARCDLTVGFRLTGRDDGETERYVVRVADGTCRTAGPGLADTEVPERRDATITCEAHDFLRLATGHLKPVTGVLKGQLRVKGDKAKALQLLAVLDIPCAVE
ncbi:MAG: SCP2 sterol-binding domain-containing protein [Nocardioides marinisabuli]|uniref:SCP2 sterol-binding domain-containing protein n=1 Tax=Nocardioides marinisabuli TaxID=419476 RepID=UPI00321AA566